MANKTEFKSANNVELVLTEKKITEGFRNGRTEWKIESKDGDYIDSVDDGIGKFYSLSLGEFKDIDEYINCWKSRYILPNLGTGTREKDTYGIDVYGISQEDFKELLKNIKFLLEHGKIVHYNDENGVGYFEKINNKYVATHYSWGTERKEDVTIDRIGEFLRDFFDIGYSYEKNNDWDDADVSGDEQ